MKNIIKVAALLKNKEGQILIFREFSNRQNNYLYNIPKGTVMESDKTLTDAIKREIYEETNIRKIRIGNTIGVYVKTSQEEDYNSILVVFEVLSFGKNVSNKNSLGDEQISDYFWLNLIDFEKMNPDDFMDNRIYLSIEKYFKNE